MYCVRCIGIAIINILNKKIGGIIFVPPFVISEVATMFHV